MNINWLAWVNENGEIKHLQSPPGGDIPEEGTVQDGLTCRHLTDMSIFSYTDNAELLSKYYWNNSSWQSRGTPPTDWYLYNFSTSSWEVNAVRLNSDIRTQRNIKLSESDWTQVPDSPLSSEKKAEWATYRQTLRDIMANLPADLDDPANVSWPTQPE